MRKGADIFADASANLKDGLVSSAIFAFNANVDLVKRTDEKGALELAKKLNLPKLEECVKQRRGAEQIVDRYKLGQLIAAGYDERRAGGQAGNMANAAAHLGLRAYMHAGTVCRDIAQHLHPGILVPSAFCFQPAAEIQSDGESPVHFVVDFGTDRYIAVYDMHNTHMLINRNFKRCAEKEIKFVDRAVVSGFHLLDIPEPKGRIEEVKVLVKRWKSGNRRLKVHLELGDYQKAGVLSTVLSMLAPECDSIGMNAQEAVDAVKALGGKWKGEADALEQLQGACKAVVIHTSDYAVAAGTGADGAEPGMAMGHMIASFTAKEGRAPGRDDLQKLQFSKVQVKDTVRKKFGKGQAFVPALRCAGERTRLGLGDAFSVGYACAAAPA
jgi:ADP-dependent phosphofructokinase/glucokinase